jgi:Mrp family chromosome partitioning ATPase
MMQSWLQSVEQIMLAAVDGKARVLGVVSPDAGAGVSTLCRMLAESHSRSGSKTLLIDLAQPLDTSEKDESWAPGDGAKQLIRPAPGGYDVLAARPTTSTRPMFNNIDVLRRMFTDELEAYQAIVVDLPPVLGQDEATVNPLAAARACDAIVLVCMTGKLTQPRLQLTMSSLAAAGVKVGGTVLNDLHNPTLGSELAGQARRLSGLAPRLSAWLERRLRSSEFLNSKN